MYVSATVLTKEIKISIKVRIMQPDVDAESKPWLFVTGGSCAQVDAVRR